MKRSRSTRTLSAKEHEQRKKAIAARWQKLENRKLPHDGAPALIEYACAKYGANISAICKVLGISQNTFYKWIRMYPEIEAAYVRGRKIEEEKLFSVLFDQAMKGNTIAAIYLTKTRHKWNDRPGMVEQKVDAVTAARKIREALAAMDKADVGGEGYGE